MSLVDLQEKKKKLLIKDEVSETKTVNNQVFVGSTNEFLEMLEKSKK
jgi:hypothetical protein